MLVTEITPSLLTMALFVGSGLGFSTLLAADRLTEALYKSEVLAQPQKSRRFVETLGVMLIGAGIASLLLLTFGLTNKALLGTAFGITLLTLSLIDLRHFVLPDALTLPMLWAGLLINIWGYFATLQDAVLGAVLGYLSLWSIYWLFKLLRGKDGLGYGDFKLTAAIGAWLGWQALPTVIFIAAITGLCAGLILMLAKRMDAEQPLPFGPFLASAGFITLSINDTVWRWLF